MSRHAVNHDQYRFLAFAISEYFRSFANAIWRITNDAIQESYCSNWCICQIRDYAVKQVVHKSILVEIAEQVSTWSSSDATAINITAECKSSKVRAGNGEATCSHEWVEHNLARSSQKHIRSDER